MDKFVGGYGLNCGRQLNRELRLGDALDFWKVVDIKPGKRLLLYVHMKVPGKAWLEFNVQPGKLVQTHIFYHKDALAGCTVILSFLYIILPSVTLAQRVVSASTQLMSAKEA